MRSVRVPQKESLSKMKKYTLLLALPLLVACGTEKNKNDGEEKTYGCPGGDCTDYPAAGQECSGTISTCTEHVIYDCVDGVWWVNTDCGAQVNRTCEADGAGGFGCVGFIPDFNFQAVGTQITYDAELSDLFIGAAFSAGAVNPDVLNTDPTVLDILQVVDLGAPLDTDIEMLTNTGFSEEMQIIGFGGSDGAQATTYAAVAGTARVTARTPPDAVEGDGSPEYTVTFTDLEFVSVSDMGVPNMNGPRYGIASLTLNGQYFPFLCAQALTSAQDSFAAGDSRCLPGGAQSVFREGLIGTCVEEEIEGQTFDILRLQEDCGDLACVAGDSGPVCE